MKMEDIKNKNEERFKTEVKILQTLVSPLNQLKDLGPPARFKTLRVFRRRFLRYPGYWVS